MLTIKYNNTHMLTINYSHYNHGIVITYIELIVTTYIEPVYK